MGDGTDQTTALESVFARVVEILKGLYGIDGFHQWSDVALMRVVHQQVVFLVLSALEQDVVINVRCYAVRDLETEDPLLGDHLVRINSEQLLGGFSIDVYLQGSGLRTLAACVSILASERRSGAI